MAYFVLLSLVLLWNATASVQRQDAACCSNAANTHSHEALPLRMCVWVAAEERSGVLCCLGAW